MRYDPSSRTFAGRLGWTLSTTVRYTSGEQTHPTPPSVHPPPPTHCQQHSTHNITFTGKLFPGWTTVRYTSGGLRMMRHTVKVTANATSFASDSPPSFAPASCCSGARGVHALENTVLGYSCLGGCGEGEWEDAREGARVHGRSLTGSERHGESLPLQQQHTAAQHPAPRQQAPP